MVSAVIYICTLCGFYCDVRNVVSTVTHIVWFLLWCTFCGFCSDAHNVDAILRFTKCGFYCDAQDVTSTRMNTM